jgi:hypothetical protein
VPCRPTAGANLNGLKPNCSRDCGRRISGESDGYAPDRTNVNGFRSFSSCRVLRRDVQMVRLSMTSLIMRCGPNSLFANRTCRVSNGEIPGCDRCPRNVRLICAATAAFQRRLGSDKRRRVSEPSPTTFGKYLATTRKQSVPR